MEDTKKYFRDKFGPNYGYGHFKDDVAKEVNNFLSGFQSRYNKLRNSDDLKKILDSGSEKAREISHKKLLEVYEKIGFVK